MALHRLTWITLGVTSIDQTRAFYRDFGLREFMAGRFATAHGGEQLRLIPAPRRCLLELGLGVDDSDDLARMAANLAQLGVPASADEGGLMRTADPASGIRILARITDRIRQPPEAAPAVNRPGLHQRTNARAEAVQATAAVRPRKLSHVVVGAKDPAASRRFFVDGLGFKVSDEVPAAGAAFLRCSSEHHNLLVQQAPVTFLHHSAWEVADADEIGRGAMRLLKEYPERHVWGLGRHCIGSNFFWYLRDPAGNFAEYSSDIDVIDDDDRWQPGSWSGIEVLMAWGPPVPASFLAPDDLPALMAG
jgi:catechol 2,3-dioxygenase-like lactoylglutathione lyase family enzyme